MKNVAVSLEIAPDACPFNRLSLGTWSDESKEDTEIVQKQKELSNSVHSEVRACIHVIVKMTGYLNLVLFIIRSVSNTDWSS